MKEKRQVYWEKDSEGVVTITIDNPEMKNGLNYVGIGQLVECYEAMAKDNSVKVAVIVGNNEFFYTGGRVDATVPGEKEKYAAAIETFGAARKKNQVPMIAAISGDCLKGGMGLVAECDFAIARQGVQFGFPEVRMGGVPMMVVRETMDLMPRKRALEAYLTSWNFSAEDAYMMGLINRVTTDEEFWPTVNQFVRVYLDTPASLVEMTRRAYFGMLELHSEEERTKFAMDMLRSEVLTSMAKTKTEYNV